MTITQVDFIEAKGGRTQAGARYERIYNVYYTGGYDESAIIQNTIGPTLPVFGMIHADCAVASDPAVAGDTKSWCTQTSVSKATNADPQDGIAVYTAIFNPIDLQSLPNPIARPPRIKWGGEAQVEAMFQDAGGTPCKNSAGDLYDPLPEREFFGPSVTITRYEYANPGRNIRDYSLTTSSDGFSGDGPDYWKMGKITAEDIWENGSKYWLVTYPLFGDGEGKGWRYLPLDNGHQHFLADGTTKRRAHDDVANTSPVPCLLDGTGKKLADGGTPVVYPTDGLLRYDSISWGPLALPNVYF